MILQFRKVEKKTVEEKKKFIEKCLTSFYNDLYETNGIIDIPAFIKAKIEVDKVCYTDKLVNYWYRRFMKKVKMSAFL